MPTLSLSTAKSSRCERIPQEPEMNFTPAHLHSPSSHLPSFLAVKKKMNPVVFTRLRVYCPPHPLSTLRGIFFCAPSSKCCHFFPPRTVDGTFLIGCLWLLDHAYRACSCAGGRGCKSHAHPVLAVLLLGAAVREGGERRSSDKICDVEISAVHFTCSGAGSVLSCCPRLVPTSPPSLY